MWSHLQYFTVMPIIITIIINIIVIIIIICHLHAGYLRLYNRNIYFRIYSAAYSVVTIDATARDKLFVLNTLALYEVCVQCPLCLLCVLPWCRAFPVCCSRIFLWFSYGLSYPCYYWCHFCFYIPLTMCFYFKICFDLFPYRLYWVSAITRWPSSWAF